jgi:hypothetical protein
MIQIYKLFSYNGVEWKTPSLLVLAFVACISAPLSLPERWGFHHITQPRMVGIGANRFLKGIPQGVLGLILLSAVFLREVTKETSYETQTR